MDVNPSDIEIRLTTHQFPAIELYNQAISLFHPARYLGAIYVSFMSQPGADYHFLDSTSYRLHSVRRNCQFARERNFAADKIDLIYINFLVLLLACSIFY